MARIFGAVEGTAYLQKFLEHSFSLGRALERYADLCNNLFVTAVQRGLLCYHL